MKAHLILMGGLLFMIEPAFAAPTTERFPGLAPAAQISEPPSATKLRLIKRYLELLGVQRQIDGGSFLERYALPGGPMWQVPSAKGAAAKPETLLGGFEARMTALKAAYAKYRTAYQAAYENHVNWEFTEQELTDIVGFLERPVGKHFLDGRWRMEAYVGTDTEEMEERIVKEAQTKLAK